MNALTKADYYLNHFISWQLRKYIIFSDDFFLALDNDGNGYVDIKDFATRIVASGKIPNGVNAEEAIKMVINTSWLTACAVG